jgi:ArsR family transcriptional regulator
LATVAKLFLEIFVRGKSFSFWQHAVTMSAMDRRDCRLQFRFHFLFIHISSPAKGILSVTAATSTDGRPTEKTIHRQPATQQVAETMPLTHLQSRLAKDFVRFFKLLSDETRLRILYLLSQAEELHVRALCELLNLSQPAVSHHLGMLRNAGIIEARRDGKHNYYRILPGNFQELTSIVFGSIPNDDDQVRFRDLDLSFRPAKPR